MVTVIGAGVLLYALFLFFFIRFLAMIQRRDRDALWRRDGRDMNPVFIHPRIPRHRL